MKTQQTAIAKLFIGIDIHKRSWKVHCSTDLSAGKTFSMVPDPEQLFCYVKKHYPDYNVTTAYEAGCCGYYAHRCFESYGWKSLVVNPADIFRRGKERYTKTDRIDAQLIARELKDGRLEGIEVPDKKREQLRSLFRRRNDLVKDMRQIKSYIKMQLLYYGIQIPDEFDNDHWSHKFRMWLDHLVFEYEPGNEVLKSRMRSFRFIDQEFRNVSTLLRKYNKQYYKKDYMLLRSIPGIGAIVASGILSELGDLRRFNGIKQSFRIRRFMSRFISKWRYGSSYRSQHAGPPIDTQLFYRGFLASDTGRSCNATLLSQISRKGCQIDHCKDSQKVIK